MKFENVLCCRLYFCVIFGEVETPHYFLIKSRWPIPSYLSLICYCFFSFPPICVFRKKGNFFLLKNTKFKIIFYLTNNILGHLRAGIIRFFPVFLFNYGLFLFFTFCLFYPLRCCCKFYSKDLYVSVKNVKSNWWRYSKATGN